MTWEQLPLVQTTERAIWDTPLASLPRWQGAALRLVRLALVLTRDLVSGQLTLRAMSLVYTTLMSIVPLLALSFSVLKAFGVHNQVAPALGRLLAPLGATGAGDHQLHHRVRRAHERRRARLGRLRAAAVHGGVADAEARGVVQLHLAHRRAAQHGRALQPLPERAAGRADPGVRGHRASPRR